MGVWFPRGHRAPIALGAPQPDQTQGVRRYSVPRGAWRCPGTQESYAPHHVPKEWIARWKGKFDQGWDALRDQILARQIELGIVPEGTALAPKPKAVPDWDTLSADEKRLFTHQVEVFAAYIEMTDHEIGRVVEAIEATGELDNTLVFLVYGDNGTSAEGGRNGMFSEMTYFNGVQETVPDMLKKIDLWGGPETYPHMASGWAVAFDTPYKWTKQVASDHGGYHLVAGAKALVHAYHEFSGLVLPAVCGKLMAFQSARLCVACHFGEFYHG